MKTVVSFAQSLELKNRPDASLLLTKPCAGTMNFDVQVVSFKTRMALETFNKKANWNAVVKTVVPKGCAIYKHQTESQVTP